MVEPLKLELLPKKVHHGLHSHMKEVVRSKMLKLLDFHIISNSW